MSYLSHTNPELQEVINRYVSHHDLIPKSVSPTTVESQESHAKRQDSTLPSQQSPEAPTTEDKDWETCQQYILQHQSTLVPGSSYLVVEKGVVTVYPNFPAAYPHVQGRDDLFEYQYRGWPPKPTRIRKVIRKFHPDDDDCLFTPVKIWYRPTGDVEHKSLDDVSMLVDTGSAKSLGPRSVLTNLGIKSIASGMSEGWDRTIKKNEIHKS